MIIGKIMHITHNTNTTESVPCSVDDLKTRDIISGFGDQDRLHALNLT